MLDIVFLDRTSLPANVNIPRPTFLHNWVEYDKTAREQIIERAQDADIIITSKVPLDREILLQLPKLKFIAITATGMNNVDLNAAKDLGIEVKNVTDYSRESVAEHVISMIFLLKRNLMNWYADQREGKWAQSPQFCYFDYPIQNIRGLTLGIIGKGSIGKEVARLAEALGMKVIFAEHRYAMRVRSGYVAFEDVLKEADVISLHCPLMPETENLINAETLALMKPTAMLINTGRGGLIDEDALLYALENGKIGGAALDVLKQEPPAVDNPLFVASQRLPNLVLTPHVAWAAERAVETLVQKIHHNLEMFVANMN